jgi:hypothetical protein
MTTAEIRYQLHRLGKQRDALPLSTSTAAGLELSRLSSRIDTLRKQFTNAQRRELLALARHLNYKADIYYPGLGRIYPARGKFYVAEPRPGCFELFAGADKLDPEKLTDGHGRTITVDSQL